jgi:hypothetical protein
MANKDRYRPSRGVPEPRLVPRGEGMVRTIYPRESMSLCLEVSHHIEKVVGVLVSYGPPWAHYLGGYQDRLLGGPLGLLGLCHTAPNGVGRKDYGGGVLG